MSNLHALEFVGHGSKTQFQVSENLNFIILNINGTMIDFDPHTVRVKLFIIVVDP